jgi:nucleoside-diphosphate-sugar epimerase
VKVLVTGGGGNAGQAVCNLLKREGYEVRCADVTPGCPTCKDEFVRCDTRTPADVEAAVAGMDAVVHLAAWHCAHEPPVSDPTIWAVNVDGTFNVLESCRRAGIKSIVYASSMAYGWGGVYSLTKVVGEEMCRSYHEMTGAGFAILRYHAFVPGPYLEYGARLLCNGVDRQDVARATVAALKAVAEKKVRLFRTIVHSNHGMPPEVVADFRHLGPGWCAAQVPGAEDLIAKYALWLPERVEQHDLSEAASLLGWRPQVGFLDFLRDLKARDARGENVRAMVVPGELPLPGE